MKKRSNIRGAGWSVWALFVGAWMGAACTAPTMAVANAASSSAPTAADLIGTWDVALYYAADAPPSATEMVITEAAKGRLVGTFYGTPFEVAHYSIRNGTLAFGAMTSDGTGLYAHSGRWTGSTIEGQTLSMGRGFFMLWTAQRRVESGAAP